MAGIPFPPDGPALEFQQWIGTNKASKIIDMIVFLVCFIVGFFACVFPGKFKKLVKMLCGLTLSIVVIGFWPNILLAPLASCGTSPAALPWVFLSLIVVIGLLAGVVLIFCEKLIAFSAGATLGFVVTYPLIVLIWQVGGFDGLIHSRAGADVERFFAKEAWTSLSLRSFVVWGIALVVGIAVGVVFLCFGKKMTQGYISMICACFTSAALGEIFILIGWFVMCDRVQAMPPVPLTTPVVFVPPVVPAVLAGTPLAQPLTQVAGVISGVEQYVDYMRIGDGNWWTRIFYDGLPLPLMCLRNVQSLVNMDEITRIFTTSSGLQTLLNRYNQTRPWYNNLPGWACLGIVYVCLYFFCLCRLRKQDAEEEAKKTQEEAKKRDGGDGGERGPLLVAAQPAPVYYMGGPVQMV